MLLMGRGLEHFGASTVLTPVIAMLVSRGVVCEVRIQRVRDVIFSRRRRQNSWVKDGCYLVVNRRQESRMFCHHLHIPPRSERWVVEREIDRWSDRRHLREPGFSDIARLRIP